MSDRHHQQRKSAIAFHLLTKVLTAKLLQTNSIGVFISNITELRGEEKRTEERREEEALKGWDKAPQWDWQLGRAPSSFAKHEFREAEDAPLRVPWASRTLRIWTRLVWVHTTDHHRSMLRTLWPQGHAATQQHQGHLLSCWCEALSYWSGSRFAPEGKQQYITPCSALCCSGFQALLSKVKGGLPVPTASRTEIQIQPMCEVEVNRQGSCNNHLPRDNIGVFHHTKGPKEAGK